MFRSAAILLVLHRNPENGHEPLLESSERSELDDPLPKGLLKGKSKKNDFFSFLLSGTPPLKTSTISGGDDTGSHLMNFKLAKRKAGGDPCLSLNWPIELNEKLVVPVP
jgi:hypothetical protein